MVQMTMEQPIDTSGYEAAKDDALGVPFCEACGERRVHSNTSDRCARCDN